MPTGCKGGGELPLRPDAGPAGQPGLGLRTDVSQIFDDEHQGDSKLQRSLGVSASSGIKHGSAASFFSAACSSALISTPMPWR